MEAHDHMVSRVPQTALAAVALAFLLTLAGCSSPTLEHRDVVGTWVNAGHGGKEAVLSFSADGTVRACGLPSPLIQSVFADRLDWTRQIGFVGRWKSQGPTIYLDIDRFLLRGLPTLGGGLGTNVSISGSASNPLLTVTLGDPDEGRVFAFRREGYRSCDPEESDE